MSTSHPHGIGGLSRPPESSECSTKLEPISRCEGSKQATREDGEASEAFFAPSLFPKRCVWLPSVVRQHTRKAARSLKLQQYFAPFICPYNYLSRTWVSACRIPRDKALLRATTICPRIPYTDLRTYGAYASATRDYFYLIRMEAIFAPPRSSLFLMLAFGQRSLPVDRP